MILDKQSKELLATLSDTPAFVLLLKVFSEFESELLASVATEKESDKLLLKTRGYQFVRMVREFLANRPQEAERELREAMSMTYQDPLRAGRNAIYQDRWSRPEDQEPVV